MAPLKTVLVDDEPLALQLLQSLLDDIPEIEVIATCRNGREALNAVATHLPDLLFLDIQMPGMNGFDVIGRLQGDIIPQVIFATAYDHYAVEAFDVNAVDYVLKPMEPERLALAVDRARARLQQQAQQNSHNQADEKGRLLSSLTAHSPQSSEKRITTDTPRKLAIKDGGRIVLANQSDIEWIDAAGDYMCVHTNGETHIMRSTLKELQQQLCPKTFKRVHRSTLVNLNYIHEIQVLTKGEYLLTLKSSEKVKVSRNYRQPIKEYLEQNQTAAAV
ncbi:LytR/AlgR family response regulator transcription factor [Microbulbifer agarilyticus]|uniref:LytR/AlgR family response regulator transcription factor n=1 Tax=Microbulbifer agarilyticus TaxID=260552 RepID=UPI001CD45972|nr:LytTR family DNA-binding domain-containing protein [Microbulbifer agarilyticus]MCA0899173.1 LytTR family DNA-binding domain-containing protein [Microbulbifer agarilyticus]